MPTPQITISLPEYKNLSCPSCGSENLMVATDLDDRFYNFHVCKDCRCVTDNDTASAIGVISKGNLVPESVTSILFGSIKRSYSPPRVKTYRYLVSLSILATTGYSGHDYFSGISPDRKMAFSGPSHNPELDDSRETIISGIHEKTGSVPVQDRVNYEFLVDAYGLPGGVLIHGFGFSRVLRFRGASGSPLFLMNDILARKIGPAGVPDTELVIGFQEDLPLFGTPIKLPDNMAIMMLPNGETLAPFAFPVAGTGFSVSMGLSISSVCMAASYSGWSTIRDDEWSRHLPGFLNSGFLSKAMEVVNLISKKSGKRPMPTEIPNWAPDGARKILCDNCDRESQGIIFPDGSTACAMESHYVDSMSGEALSNFLVSHSAIVRFGSRTLHQIGIIYQGRDGKKHRTDLLLPFGFREMFEKNNFKVVSRFFDITARIGATHEPPTWSGSGRLRCNLGRMMMEMRKCPGTPDIDVLDGPENFCTTTGGQRIESLANATFDLFQAREDGRSMNAITISYSGFRISPASGPMQVAVESRIIAVATALNIAAWNGMSGIVRCRTVHDHKNLSWRVFERKLGKGTMIPTIPGFFPVPMHMRGRKRDFLRVADSDDCHDGGSILIFCRLLFKAMIVLFRNRTSIADFLAEMLPAMSAGRYIQFPSSDSLSLMAGDCLELKASGDFDGYASGVISMVRSAILDMIPEGLPINEKSVISTISRFGFEPVNGIFRFPEEAVEAVAEAHPGGKAEFLSYVGIFCLKLNGSLVTTAPKPKQE